MALYRMNIDVAFYCEGDMETVSDNICFEKFIDRLKYNMNKTDNMADIEFDLESIEVLDDDD